MYIYIMLLLPLASPLCSKFARLEARHHGFQTPMLKWCKWKDHNPDDKSKELAAGPDGAIALHSLHGFRRGNWTRPAKLNFQARAQLMCISTNVLALQLAA